MKTVELIPVYATIYDSLGDKAEVYYMDDGNHEIRYYGTNGVQFWKEVFERETIENVEQLAISWATGRRELT